MADIVARLREYHMLGEEGEEFVMRPITPTKDMGMRMIACSESDAEILANVGDGLCKLGAIEAGLVLIGMAAAWRIGLEP